MKFVFLTPNKQGVASDQGFVLQSVAREAFEYREANRVMRLEGERLFPPDAGFGFAFYPRWREARWQPPFENVPVSDSDRERIVENIKAAMAFMGGKVEFE
jgi:hypothetical protein